MRPESGFSVEKKLLPKIVGTVVGGFVGIFFYYSVVSYPYG